MEDQRKETVACSSKKGIRTTKTPAGNRRRFIFPIFSFIYLSDALSSFHCPRVMRCPSATAGNRILGSYLPLMFEPSIQSFRAVILSRASEKTLVSLRPRIFHPSHNQVSRSALPAAGPSHNDRSRRFTHCTSQRAIYVQIALSSRLTVRSGLSCSAANCYSIRSVTKAQSCSASIGITPFVLLRNFLLGPGPGLGSSGTAASRPASFGCFPCSLLCSSAHPYNTTSSRK